MTLEFYLNDKKIELDDVRADATVLDFLRENQKLHGTKEGCAEGDCGACTVLIGRMKNGVLNYHSMNACIAFLPMLHRAHVVTIEALSHDGALHPVQESIVNAHGTQCGFCTPGIVMSLYAAWLNAPSELDYEGFQKAMQGNLCRCTGYASIARGFLDMNAPFAQDALMQGRTKMAQKLEALGHEMVAMEGDAPFFIPQNLQEVEAVSAMHPNAVLVSGATDVGIWVTKQFRKIAPVIFLHQISDLYEINIGDDEITLGAMVSFDEAETALRDVMPQLRDYWPRIAGQQIRNMGTLGGNIANGSPIGDSPPVLIALGARIVLNHGGKRREIPIEDYFIDYGKQDRAPGEFLERIIIPRKDVQLAVHKVSKRRDEDISAMLAALAFEMRDGKIQKPRLAFGGMAATPKRAKNAEAALENQTPSEAIIRDAMKALEKDFTPMSDARASAEYRMRLAQNAILRGFEPYMNS